LFIIKPDITFLSTNGILKTFFLLQLITRDRDAQNLVGILEKVLSGTHVLLEDKDNFKYIYLNELPQTERCKFAKKKFHFSKSTVTLQTAGWLFSKKFSKSFQETVNLKLMWLDSTGLVNCPHSSNDETGIYSSTMIDKDCNKLQSSKEETCKDDNQFVAPLSVFQLKNAFIGLLVGYVMASLAFVSECIFDKLLKVNLFAGRSKYSLY
jgi:hypothetical protein